MDYKYSAKNCDISEMYRPKPLYYAFLDMSNIYRIFKFPNWDQVQIIVKNPPNIYVTILGKMSMHVCPSVMLRQYCTSIGWMSHTCCIYTERCTRGVTSLCIQHTLQRRTIPECTISSLLIIVWAQTIIPWLTGIVCSENRTNRFEGQNKLYVIYFETPLNYLYHRVIRVRWRGRLFFSLIVVFYL